MDLLLLAKNVTARIKAQAAPARVPAAVCVVDVHRNVVLRTADLLAQVQPGQQLHPLMTVTGGRYCAIGGSAPLASEGEVVAGVGVSEGTAKQDIAIVESVMK